MPALHIPPASIRRPELVPIRQPNSVFHQHIGRASVPRYGCAGGLSGRVLPAASRVVMRQATPAVSSQQALQTAQLPDRCLITTSVTAKTFNEALLEIAEACSSGADLVELRIDCIQDLDVKQHLPALLDACTVPAIVTYRPQWEDPSSTYVGPEDQRIQGLQYAASLGPAFVDCEYEASAAFFAGKEQFATRTRIILSKHDFNKTLPMEALQELTASMWAAGADVVKIAMMAQDISDCLPMFNLLKEKKGPTVSLSMSEKGQPVRLLAPKFGGFLTFAAMSPERASAPGQPTVQDMRELYRVPSMSASTKVYGIVGNPVSHSRSPLIHNRAMAYRDVDGVYIPLLVDDMPSFLQAFSDADFQGFSVTIPHKEAAYQAAASMDEVAKQIGAVNTLIRQEDGSLKGYNTDWSAAISAIERGLASGSSSADAASPLQGKTVVVVGAGGAGRALAFGAAFKGAKVVVTNRNRPRAEGLANEVPGGAEVADLAAVQAGDVTGHVLVNTTSQGMHPKEEETPVPEAALGSYELVFDAIYTPMETRLLREAKANGCVAVSGFEMFVGQAADQFRYFTGKEPPVELMSDVVLASLQK